MTKFDLFDMCQAESRILMIIADIASHTVPALDFAKQYLHGSVCFAGGAKTRLHVEQAGYRFVELKTENFQPDWGLSLLWNQFLRKERNIWAVFDGLVKTEIYRERSRELNFLLEELKPSLVLLDIFSSTDYVYLDNRHTKVLFFSPMLHTALVDGNFNEKMLSFSERWAWRITKTTQFLGRLSFKLLLARNGVNVEIDDLSLSSMGLVSFPKVPQIVLAPQELESCETTELLDKWYSGLNVIRNRVTPDVDPEYYKMSKSYALEGATIIYCSFGSFYQDPSEINIVLAFFQKLTAFAQRRPELVFVIAAISLVKEMMHRFLDIPINMGVFSRVPQLEMLNQANVFITHAGLGSIKEAIHCKVPMLLLPLDHKWDQPSNARSCDRLCIGRSCDLESISSVLLESEIDALLTNPEYRSNISKLNESICSRYNDEFTKQLKNFICTF